MNITFRLNGETVSLSNIAPTTTLLDWLREDQGLKGTKEGCNEGDCGACTVMVTDNTGAKTLNACILFMPQINGKAIRTVEGISAPDGTLHPVQERLIDRHGSQCGFCTPGFVVSMATAHLNGATDHDTQLAGNLCRCTGYAPIVRAAQDCEASEIPDHMRDTPIPNGENTAGGKAKGFGGGQPPTWVQPKSTDELADWYAQHPDATLVGGATDVGLWVTKGFRDLGPVAFLNQCADLAYVRVSDTEIDIGAATTLTDLQTAIAPFHPSFSDLIQRYGSVQVRNAATIGGNIANGSPIGDGSPALIALNATLHLRHADKRRSLPLQDFFIEYGKQDRKPGEFVERISIPRSPDNLKCYKISKRFDQDISAVCGCFAISVSNGIVATARLAFGGMAGTPKRASTAEQSLMGAAWNGQSVRDAMTALASDFTPLSDMRASADYRMSTAQNMLWRYWLESTGAATSVHEVAP
ncbi:MAG: xanthine dehydrogenase small subunit [Roseobacter sp.]